MNILRVIRPIWRVVSGYKIYIKYLFMSAHIPGYKIMRSLTCTANDMLFVRQKCLNEKYHMPGCKTDNFTPAQIWNLTSWL